MDRARLDSLVAEQEGVVSRRQALACGLTDNDIARLVRRREWARVHDGVYVNHTGPLTWLQRAWAAVLFHWPAALAGSSALRIHRVRSVPAPLQVVSEEPITSSSITVAESRQLRESS
jgi:Transcriptional regulator, AbiEi antitoxin